MMIRALVLAVIVALFVVVVSMHEPSQRSAADSSVFVDKSSIGGANE
jgi:hypothetical protein